MSEEIESLIVEIKNAFADMTYPRRVGDPYELVGLMGKQWQELSVNDVVSNYDFFLFSDEGFKYFLPGYFVVMLQNPEEMKESFVRNGILRHLSQAYTQWPQRDLCKLFDKTQRKTILKFLDMFEILWLSSEDIEKRVSKVNRQQKDWVRKGLEERNQETMNLLEKAKQYWQQCE